MSENVILIILDGWGHGKVYNSDALQHAQVPFIKSLYTKFPHSELVTFGEDVGLPNNQMGNSEVGHLNIGSGRVVYQELLKIDVAIRSHEFQKNDALLKSMDYALQNNRPLHFIGLLSDGGVHSHISHLETLCDMALAHKLPQVYLHLFTDGRDTSPTAGINYIEQIQQKIKYTPIQIATVIGRYYAMDRDKRWERVKIAYDAMVHAKGTYTSDILLSVQKNYENNCTDEFIKPLIVVGENGKPIAKIEDEDAVICFNFRTDRCREITEVLTQKENIEFEMKPLKLFYTTLTEYDRQFKNIQVAFTNNNLVNTLGEILEKNNKTQIRIAETEKYPHVTYFFSGGREIPFEGEKRILIPSPKDVPTYDYKPQMSANEITEAILPEIEKRTTNFICLNFANTDMVGHTGVWDAVVKAAETVDVCVEKIVNAALKSNYTVFLTADHGNSDYMINEDGTPNTAHTKNPVPFICISNHIIGELKNGKLADIAPTILKCMGIPIPQEMTGNLLL